MSFERMPIEEWFDEYQFETDFDIGESGVKWITVGDLELDLSDVALRYGHHRGAPELREVIASDYEGLTADHVAVTSGSSETIFALIAGLVGPDEEIIIEHPNYPTHYFAAASLGRKTKFFHLRFDQQFNVDLDALAGMITPKTKLVSLTHPNNPTGSVLSTEALERIVRLVEANDAYLLMDETYRELSYAPPPPPAANLSPRAISVTTLSKAYGAPGIRIGWAAVADPGIIEIIRTVREQITICNSALGERVALEILKRKASLLPATRQRVLSNLETLSSWMDTRQDLEWVPPAAGVVAFPSLKGEDSADELCRTLIEQYRTFTVPGSCFEMPAHFRLGYGGSPLELEGGLERLGNALDERKANNTV